MIALRVRSTYSAGRGLSRPDAIAARLTEAGYSGAVLADHATLGGVPSFCAALGKSGLKAIAGTEFVLEDGFLTAISLDQAGWRSLVRHTTLSNTADRFDRGPRLLNEDLDVLGRDCILLDGYCFSRLATVLVRPEFYQSASSEEALSCLREDWLELGRRFILEQKERFLQYYLGVECCDPSYAPALALAGAVREIARTLDLTCLPLMDAHYPQQEDATDQRVLCCIALKCTVQDAQDTVAYEHPSLQRYFRTGQLFIWPRGEFGSAYSSGELALLEEIFSKAESPVLKGKPAFPNFIPPAGKTCDEAMRDECRLGWRRVIEPLLKKAPTEERARLKQVYGDRAKSELETLVEAGLSPYFLCVQDVIQYAKDVLRKKVGRGRGSVGGSLVAWLMGITGVDPIEHDLLFERFWNKARKDSVPDIDTDFEQSAREPVVAYLHEKYGEENVCRIGTYSVLNGKSAIDDVLRAHGRCSFMERKRITKAIPDKSRITDDLQEMFEEEGSSSIIRWSLENRAEAFREWACYDEEGRLTGPLWPDFAQAMRLEGTVRNMGVHACGVIVSPAPLADLIPLVRSEHGERVTGFTMGEAEKIGLTKLDILGLVTLDRVSLVERLLRTGSFD